jgi:hypothetical protein
MEAHNETSVSNLAEQRSAESDSIAPPPSFESGRLEECFINFWRSHRRVDLGLQDELRWEEQGQFEAMGWWPWGGQSKQPDMSVHSRTACYDSRDEYFACLGFFRHVAQACLTAERTLCVCVVSS